MNCLRCLAISDILSNIVSYRYLCVHIAAKVGMFSVFAVYSSRDTVSITSIPILLVKTDTYLAFAQARYSTNSIDSIELTGA